MKIYQYLYTDKTKYRLAAVGNFSCGLTRKLFLLKILFMNLLRIIDENGMSTVTMWVVGDFQKPSGRKLMLNALKLMVSFITSF